MGLVRVLGYADPLTPPRAFIGLATGLLLVLYVGPLFLDTPLTDPDEGLHASIVQEMHERGERIVPHFLGEPFLDKPVLYFWTQLASISAFGMSAAAVRLPGLLFALLSIATTGWLAHSLLPATGYRLSANGQLPATGYRPAWLAAACYGTLAVPFGLAQAPVHDVALVPMANLALLAFWRLGEIDAGRINAARAAAVLGAGVALGLSVLTKGLAVIAIVGLAYALTLVITRRMTIGLVLSGIAALVIAALVAAPWYMAMETREPGYLQYYFVSRHLLGFATDSQQHGGQPLWYYVPIVGAGGLPWILYLWRGGGTSTADRGGVVLLWCWLLGGLLMLSVSGSKLVTYALPVFPPIAILAARRWASALALPDGGAALRALARVHASIFAVVTVALPWAAARIGGGSAGWPGWIAFGAAGLGWLWLWQRIPERPLSWSWRRLSLGTGATFALALAMLGPSVAEAHSARELAGHLNRLPHFPPRVFLVAERVGSIVFYLRPDLRQSLDRSRFETANAGDVGALAGPGDVIAVRRKDIWRLGETLAAWDGHRTTVGRHVVYGPRPR